MKENSGVKLQWMEWNLLFAIAGVKHIWGFDFDTTSMKQQETIMCIHRMLKKEMLTIKDDKICISEKYKELTDGIKNAEQVWFVETFLEDQKQKSIVYAGEKLFIVETVPCQKRFYQISVMTKEHWLNELKEKDGYYVTSEYKAVKESC